MAARRGPVEARDLAIGFGAVAAHPAAWFDTDGRSVRLEIAPPSEAHVWRAYRGMVPATAMHPELWTQTVVVEWGGTGPCPAWEAGRAERLVAPDGTTYDVVPGEDAEFNGQWTIVAT